MVMGMAGRHLMTNVKYVVHYAFECQNMLVHVKN